MSGQIGQRPPVSGVMGDNVMIRAALAAAVSLAALAAAPPALAQQPGPSALWRASFLVEDLDAARAVWGEALGFELAYEKASSLTDPRLSALYGLDEGEAVELLVFISGDTAVGNIGFLKPEAGLDPVEGRAGRGAAALFIKTTDMDGHVAALEAAGAEMLAPPESVVEGGSRMAWFVDPNGVRFVLTEREAIALAYPDRSGD